MGTDNVFFQFFLKVSILKFSTDNQDLYNL